MVQIVLSLRDDILKRYGNSLGSLGEEKAQKVMARALNYEGKKAHVAVKRALRKQTSIPYGLLNRGVSTRQASTKVGNALQFVIVGKGRPFPMKVFKPTQFKKGVKVTVWGRRQMYDGAFMFAGRYNSGKLMPGGQVFKNTGKFSKKSKRNNQIKMEYGPSVPKEIVKDEAAKAFYASTTRIADRVGKEIAAVLRGF
jgi:hypothetical protein